MMLVLKLLNRPLSLETACKELSYFHVKVISISATIFYLLNEHIYCGVRYSSRICMSVFIWFSKAVLNQFKVNFFSM